jgi:hypothetical protein
MIEGSRQLPIRHISVCVPWHDGRWAGTVCSDPRANTSCLALTHIRNEKDDDFEAETAGQLWDVNGVSLPPCAAERGAFMAPFEYCRHVEPEDRQHRHFSKTVFYHRAFSLAPVPFAWLRKQQGGIPAKAKQYAIGFEPEREKRPGRPPDRSVDPKWVQEKWNQLAMLDTFFDALKPEESLVLCYAKQTPLTDDHRRVIVGLGRVLKVEPHVEWTYNKYDSPRHFHSVLWERNVLHSIRSTMEDGFLLPYHSLLQLARESPSVVLPSLVLHVSDEHREAFSSGAEHVTNDQAITVLISCASLLQRYEKILPGNWLLARDWVDSQLNRIWRMRGPFPGLGSALTAFGFNNGTLIAYEIEQLLNAGDSKQIRDPWHLVDKVIHDPTLLPSDLAPMIGPNVAKRWDALEPERRSLLKLLARFEITEGQATRWFVLEERERSQILLSDQEIISNPYLCFEADRGGRGSDPISVRTIDRGLFPEGIIAAVAPVPKPSCCSEPIDPRRVRALFISSLDIAGSRGHTLLPQNSLVQRTRSLDVVPRCAVGSDWFNAFAPDLAPRLDKVSLEDGSPAWQLREFTVIRELIAATVKRQLAGKPHVGNHNWGDVIDDALDPLSEAVEQETEERARKEKARALEVIFRSRFSVLVGPAGTGKTTVLTALLSVPGVSEGGVLLLAPTGKARVMMQKGGRKAYTLAQFLLKYDRYHPKTGAYRVTNAPRRERGLKTVIVDECSMLSEAQLAATLDAIECRSVERLILVGDPSQLPPIGAGRPFVDIVRYVRGSVSSAGEISTGYAELSINLRQAMKARPDSKSPVQVRDDVLLARSFCGEAPEPGLDEVWDRIAGGRAHGIRAVRWDDETDLQDKLLIYLKQMIQRNAKRSGVSSDDWETLFEVSLGGQLDDLDVHFHSSAGAEEWQILSPVQVGAAGVVGLNRLLQKQFRERARQWAEPEEFRLRKAYKPLGPERILYGDKVINVKNGPRHDVDPRAKSEAYLANGEIGMVVGQYKRKDCKKWPSKVEVEFSSQRGFRYGFDDRDFNHEGDNPLELAYALTIHKAQGSEFGGTFVVLPDPCALLSRELLYTALTRQRKGVVVFHQGELRSLVNLKSVTARRLTNLFVDPKSLGTLESHVD